MESTVVPDIAEGLGTLESMHYDLLTFNCLTWSMVQDERYAAHRAQYAFDISETQQATIESHLQRGGGLLGLHTAAICFDTWADWPGILGAGWAWGQSYHPRPGPVSVQPCEKQHPILQGIGTFELTDELYCGITVAGDAAVLATAVATGCDGRQPILTTRNAGDARIVYSSLGHDMRSLGNENHRSIIKNAALWACGKI